MSYIYPFKVGGIEESYTFYILASKLLDRLIRLNDVRKILITGNVNEKVMLTNLTKSSSRSVSLLLVKID